NVATPLYSKSRDAIMTSFDADPFAGKQKCTRAPLLGSINGVGLIVYGRRDFDPNTATYVKTHCFCFLFIPVLALGAYRVRDAPNGGWYFICKEKLSGLARIFNLLVFSSIFVGIGMGV